MLSPALVDAMQHGEGVPFSEDRQQRHERALGDDVPQRAGWQWDMIWDDGGMYKGGYSISVLPQGSIRR